MYTGNEQVLKYSTEANYGIPVTPNTSLGIIIAGRVTESNTIHSFSGIESKWVNYQKYGKYECSGACTIIVQALDVLEWGCTRQTNTSELQSRTIDVGINSITKRMSGSKVSKMQVSFNVDSPLTVDFDWISQQCTDGSSTTHVVSSDHIWVPTSLIVMCDGVELADLESFELEVVNNLIPKYLANQDSNYPRGLTYIEEGRQEFNVKLKGGDLIDTKVRGESINYAADGFDILVEFADACSEDTAYISVVGCFQAQTTEQLSPNSDVVFDSSYSAKLIEFGFTAGV